MSTTLSAVTTSEAGEWRRALSLCERFDAYHLPEYHRVAERAGEGESRLFVYRDGPYAIALPVILRPLRDPRGGLGRDLRDATSVYGYAGPVSSHRDPPRRVVDGFARALAERLRAENVVSLFARLHPLLDQGSILEGCGDQVVAGTTVSIDLTLSPEAQRGLYRQNHARDIRKLARRGFQCAVDPDYARLDEFVGIYHDTMRRLEADDSYFFSRDDFRRLTRELGDHAALFSCALEGRLVSGGIVLLCGGIAQYHLGATHRDFLRRAPSKLLFDFVRSWATARGMHTLHLGGGVGGRRDSLFHFKIGFSNRTHEFKLWRWILQPDVYERLSGARRRRLAAEGAAPPPDFFPAYRAPGALTGSQPP